MGVCGGSPSGLEGQSPEDEGFLSIFIEKRGQLAPESEADCVVQPRRDGQGRDVAARSAYAWIRHCNDEISAADQTGKY